ncbi:unnamed protein product [Cuscuta epithymum]|uniref:Pectinesterase inhibitor domain-containing protein n=1 Tax=Cuscuta epithymum TaxID=186058 RepID=A0AAV0E597_9ASTE|nr:unnamed protein product [Cuscuta epithymum]
MAASNCHKVSILFAFYATIIVYQISVTNGNRDLIGGVCAKAQYPVLCNHILRADPDAKKADDMKDLLAAAINIAKNQAITVETLVNSLLKNGTVDQKLKSALKPCLRNYGDSIKKFGECRDYFESGDYGGVNAQASTALDNIGTCNERFSPSNSTKHHQHDDKPIKPLNLKVASSLLQGACDIVLVITYNGFVG